MLLEKDEVPMVEDVDKEKEDALQVFEQPPQPLQGVPMFQVLPQGFMPQMLQGKSFCRHS